MGNCLTGCGQMVVIEKLADGVFLHTISNYPKGGYIFTKGYAVLTKDTVSFFTPEGVLQGKHLIKNICLNGETFTNKEDFAKKLKEIGHIVYDATMPPPIDNTALFEEMLEELKNLGADCDVNVLHTKDCDRQALLDSLTAIKDELVLIKEENLNDDAYNLFEDTDGNVIWGKLSDDGTTYKYYKADGSEYTGVVKPYTREVIQIINDYCANGVPFSRIEFRDADTKEVLSVIWRNDDDFTEGTITPTGATKGVCKVEVIAPQCIENVSYDLKGARGIVFESSKLNSYDVQVIKGEMKFTEKNNVDFIEEVYNHANGFNDDYKLLPNELKVVNLDANSRTIIKVLQVCEYVPIQADVIDGSLVLLISAIPKVDNTAIDVKFSDVPSATGFRVKRYIVGQDVSTATTLIDWTEGVSNPLITNNGDGTYTYKDATAVADTDYMYFYEAYNAISDGISNEIEASLFPVNFIPVMKTTTANELVTLPMTTNAPVVIDWGDGITETKSAPFTHTYARAGKYDIEVKITTSREVTNFRFANTGDKLKLVDIKNWGWVNLTAGSNFQGCVNLETITAEDAPSGLINMGAFFTGCSKLVNIVNFNKWNTSQVWSMRSLFAGCSVFNQSVSHFDTANVIDMSSMFQDAPTFNQSVSNFDTSKVTTMYGMFSNASSFNQSVANFNTSNVTNMYLMFYTASAFNQSVSNFDTSKVTTMYGMFSSSKFNQSIANFNTANVTDMGHMFSQSPFNQPVSTFNTSKVTRMSYMFAENISFNQPVPFDTTKVTNLTQMFYKATAFNQDINFSIPLVTTIYGILWGATAFTTARYDNMLINFAGQTTQNNVDANAQNKTRTSASDTARATLVARGWVGLS